MKKFITLLIFISSLLKADDYLLMGAGPYIQTQPYTDTDAFILPSPVVFLQYKIFYVRWSQMGVYFYGGENWGLSLMIQPRPNGYRAEDSKTLKGMKTRKTSWEGGISLAGKNDLGFGEIIYANDMLNSSNRSLIRGEIGTKIKMKKWTFVPSFLLLWFSEGFNNYYYGVTHKESNTDRRYYHAQAGINAAFQNYIKYQITPKYSVLTNMRADILNSTITQSPIVSDKYIFSGMISLLYTFDL